MDRLQKIQDYEKLLGSTKSKAKRNSLARAIAAHKVALRINLSEEESKIYSKLVRSFK